jgi:C-terminal processing protease CtpA/Prc
VTQRTSLARASGRRPVVEAGRGGATIGAMGWARTLFLGACAFAGGAICARVADAGAVEPDSGYRALAVFARAYQHIEASWVGDVEGQQLAHAAIRGMVGALDAHSRYYTPAEAAQVERDAQAREAERGRATVTYAKLPRDVGYLAITRFADMTEAEVVAALAGLRPLSGLVLDLRDDSGGLLRASVRVADLWLEDGVIVSTRGRNRPPETERAFPKGTEPSYPIVALVNERTASAAEVLAAALADHGRARLVGSPTYGKGSVQTIIELEDKSVLKLTVARYYTPRGRSLEGQGLVPDVVVADLSPRPAILLEDGPVRAAYDLITGGGPGSFTAPKPRAISNP